LKVALLGANGFVGIRAVERWVGNGIDVRPIVRGFPSMARLSRFDLDIRIANALDEDALKKVFEGCDVVVHAVAGNADVVEGSAPAYRAADAVGVKRLVYISSASVHGQDPAPNTDESSALDLKQWSWYNLAKIRAERSIRKARKSGSTEVVILRPGIVWGPRSRWVADFVEGLMTRKAYVVSGGNGVLNSIFVDNLIHAIELGWAKDGVDGEAFIVQDDESVTWRELYQPLCDAMGRNWDEVWDIGSPPPPKKDRVESIRGSKTVQKVLPAVPGKLKRVGKAALKAMPEPVMESPFALPVVTPPTASEEMAKLHTCGWRLPDDKARRLLRYAAERSFDEGMEITLRWLKSAGYPLSEQALG